MVDEAKENKVQFNLWIDKEDLEWVNKMTEKFPFHVSANEFMRQLIKDKRFLWENDGLARDPNFFVYIEGKYR